MPNAEHLKEYQFKKGQTGNAGGRPKGSLKSYVASKLAKMTDKQKDAYLKSINKEFQWKMGEGNPHQTQENSGSTTIIIEGVPDAVVKKLVKPDES